MLWSAYSHGVLCQGDVQRRRWEDDIIHATCIPRNVLTKWTDERKSKMCNWQYTRITNVRTRSRRFPGESRRSRDTRGNDVRYQYCHRLRGTVLLLPLLFSLRARVPKHQTRTNRKTITIIITRATRTNTRLAAVVRTESRRARAMYRRRVRTTQSSSHERKNRPFCRDSKSVYKTRRL